MSKGRILYLDAYDSFSNNIISLLRSELDVEVCAIRIDDERFVNDNDGFCRCVSGFDAVVAGPGPGHPAITEDVGLIARLWTISDVSTIPVLGVCLGFQSLCLSHGATVTRLTQPRHGIVTPISHRNHSIFRSVDNINATQYHSLHVKLPDREPVDKCQDLWAFPKNGLLRPLAWDLSDAGNGPILMAVEHAEKPWIGMQFHPESTCTNPEGRKLISNWWKQACVSNQHRVRPSTCSPAIETPNKKVKHDCDKSILEVQSISLPLTERITAIDVAQAFRTDPVHEPLVLQSGTRDGRSVYAETGRYSIVSIPDSLSVHVRYNCSDKILSMSIGDDTLLNQSSNTEEVFATLEQFIQEHRADGGHPDVPFWGGLIGFVSYEAGLESIQVLPPRDESAARSDVWFVFVERSIVIDHKNHCIHIQSIRKSDSTWLCKTKLMVQSLGTICSNGYQVEVSSAIQSMPDPDEYRDKVRECQSHLRAGSSYELCLTDQTDLHCNADAWRLYTSLTNLNPAPFAAYMRLQSSIDDSNGVTIIGSSPERFLSWTRSGQCQFRPIKGTVSKENGMTRDRADKILNSTKERAENLMIVDLIRHDLAGVPGIRDVRVPLLMSTEEYESVYQLVSVIEGDLAPTRSGISVLAASLPPGSMTGAPKRRSCELLKHTENGKPRGLYSGVLGYMDVGGGGDFSVVIRTAYKWDDDSLWRIGAGGAVTILSTVDGEYDEMTVKRERLLKLFCP